MDTRYAREHVTTHTGDKLQCIATDRLLPLLEGQQLLDADVIAVDEAQFFPDLVSDTCRSAPMGTQIIIFAFY